MITGWLFWPRTFFRPPTPPFYFDPAPLDYWYLSYLPDNLYRIDINELLSKVKDPGKASMSKLLAEDGDKAPLERSKENLFYHGSCKLSILNTSKSSSRKRVYDLRWGRVAPKTGRVAPKGAKILYQSQNWPTLQKKIHSV